MKKLVSLIFYSILLFANAPLVQATPVAPEVQRLYAATQQGQMQHVENILDWHRADKKKPEALLQQARALAIQHNDAQTAVALTTRLKQEQMGSWERYFRGITLAATVTVLAVLVSKVGFDRYKENKENVSNPIKVQQENEQLRLAAVVTEADRHRQPEEVIRRKGIMTRIFGTLFGQPKDEPQVYTPGSYGA